MFCVLYSFEVLPEKDKEFLVSWRGMTELIRDYEGGLGSRLHKKDDGGHIAYAQWPNKKTWEGSGDKLPESAAKYRKLMRESCTKIETMETMQVTDDLLVK
jgi:heme-degrading monooxygenase HmoA